MDKIQADIDCNLKKKVKVNDMNYKNVIIEQLLVSILLIISVFSFFFF